MATDRVDFIFKPTVVESDLNNAGDITLSQQKIRISVRLTTMSVTSIYIESETLTNYLDTNANPNTPYTPQYPWSPATKKYVDDNIPTKVSDLTNDSDFQTATQVNQAISTAISSAYKYKWSVANQAALPASGNTTGDVWNTEDTGMNYAWTGSAWDALWAIVDLSGKQDKLIAWSNIQIASDWKTISSTDTKYTAGTWISIDANNVISNTQTSAEWWNITWTLSDQTDLQTALNAKQDNMVILKYWISTWNDFITAYNKNWVIYCRASSNSNPASWSQTRLAFMAYVNNETAPTEVEFQYYRSRSSHSTAATVLDEVYVYKLVSTGGWTWSVTQRDTAAKPLAWTWIWFTYNASGMTISADTTTLATKTDLNSKQDTLVSWTNIKTVNNQSLLWSWNITIQSGWVTSVNGQTWAVTVNDVKVWNTAPSNPTDWIVWYDTDLYNLQVYNWSTHQWDTLNNIFHMVTPWVWDDMADYINILEDSWSRLLIFSFNENMSDLWIVTDYGRENWDEQTQKYENFKITAIWNVSDNADTTFIQDWWLTRPKWIATLEIIWTHQLDTYVCSTVQFKESWWLKVAPNSTITGIKYIRHWTEADYANLSQYYTDVPGDTEFHCF